MQFIKRDVVGSLSLLVASVALARRPSNMSICDYHTITLLMNNTAENKMILRTLVVNKAAIGNYTQSMLA